MRSKSPISDNCSWLRTKSRTETRQPRKYSRYVERAHHVYLICAVQFVARDQLCVVTFLAFLRWMQLGIVRGKTSLFPPPPHRFFSCSKSEDGAVLPLLVSSACACLALCGVCAMLQPVCHLFSLSVFRFACVSSFSLVVLVHAGNRL